MNAISTAIQNVKSFVRQTNVVDHASHRVWVGQSIEAAAWAMLGIDILFDVLDMWASLPLVFALVARAFVLFVMTALGKGVDAEKERRFLTLNPSKRTRLVVEVTILVTQIVFETLLAVIFGIGTLSLMALVPPMILLVAAVLYAYEGLR